MGLLSHETSINVWQLSITLASGLRGLRTTARYPADFGASTTNLTTTVLGVAGLDACGGHNTTRKGEE